MDIEFVEFVPRNHLEIRNKLKQQCKALKKFNKNWWTRLIPGDRGIPNYRIEVNYIVRREFIKCNYDVFMQMPLEETELNKPNSIKKGQKKRLKPYQHQEDLKTIKETMPEIIDKLEHDYRVAYDAMRRSSS